MRAFLGEQAAVLGSVFLWFVIGKCLLTTVPATDILVIYGIVNAAYYGVKLLPKSFRNPFAHRVAAVLIITYLSIWAYFFCGRYLMSLSFPVSVPDLFAMMGRTLGFAFGILGLYGVFVAPLIYVNIGIMLKANHVDGDWFKIQ